MSQPFAPLSAWFQRVQARATAVDGTDEDVLEALAAALGLAVLVGLDGLAATDRKALVSKGRRAILAAGPGKGRGEEAEDLRMAIAHARAGLSALEGKVGDGRVGPSDPMHPPDGRLSAATLGRLDGFALASVALHVSNCEGCAKRLAVLRMASTPALLPLRVAAATAVAMRKPDAGRVVATVREPLAEVVLFDDEGERTIAVYSEASAPVRLVGEGLETIEMLAGYWLGSVEASATKVSGTLHVGDLATELDFTL